MKKDTGISAKAAYVPLCAAVVDEGVLRYRLPEVVHPSRQVRICIRLNVTTNISSTNISSPAAMTKEIGV